MVQASSAAGSQPQSVQSHMPCFSAIWDPCEGPIGARQLCCMLSALQNACHVGPMCRAYVGRAICAACSQPCKTVAVHAWLIGHVGPMWREPAVLRMLSPVHCSHFLGIESVTWDPCAGSVCHEPTVLHALRLTRPQPPRETDHVGPMCRVYVARASCAACSQAYWTAGRLCCRKPDRPYSTFCTPTSTAA